MKNRVPWQILLTAGFAGALAPLAFSPAGLWPLGLLSVAILFRLLQKTFSTHHASQVGWAYGCGFFGAGVSWVYVSINSYGNAPPLLAAFLTLLFVVGLALLFALQCWCYQRFFKNSNQVLSFTALWVAFEWLRSWLLTGFPWLYLGYSQLTAPLAGFAPIIGVLGISFIVVLSSCSIVCLTSYLLQKNNTLNKHILTLCSALCLLWLLPAGLFKIDWTQEQPEKKISVGLVQANIDQNQKFDRYSLQAGFDIYDELSQTLWDNTIVLWPETAIPLDLQQAQSRLEIYNATALLTNSSFITGIFARENNSIFNSIISIGNGEGIYYKQKLVPFGEYVPFSKIMNSLMQIFNLPMSELKPGPPKQSLLQASGLMLAPFICYEVVYPDFVRQNSVGADFLVTISNDTWFGASFGPLQHLQMAAMRALENGRYMVRSTNNGISAIINEKGKIISRTEQFKAAVLSGEVKVFSGRTPFSYWGSYPILLLCGFLLLQAYLQNKPKVRTHI